MSLQDLRDLLERVDDTRELVLDSATAGPGRGELHAVWDAARAEAAAAYATWRDRGGRDAYAVYGAAADRADAAADALAAAAAR